MKCLEKLDWCLETIQKNGDMEAKLQKHFNGNFLYYSLLYAFYPIELIFLDDLLDWLSLWIHVEFFVWCLDFFDTLDSN